MNTIAITGQSMKIIKPADHALVNTDMVDVLIASSTSNIKVNGRIGLEALGEKYDGKDVYSIRVWLRQGFNTIKAQATAEDGAIYTDSITVFYYKDDSIFNFVSPLAGHIFKYPQDNWLEVTGEIGAKYQDTGYGTSENAELNTVTLKVIYYPNNPLYSPVVLAKDLECKIEETTIESSQSGYMFYNLSAISLSGCESGEIEIIAYKNKQGTFWENEIHRFVYIDNSRLWIDLVQPKIFGRDTLDAGYKLDRFNNPEDEPFSNTVLEDNGSFKLATQYLSLCQ